MALCLVVEDEARQRSIVEGILRAEGHETVAVDSGAAAVEACRRHRPEVVLLDLGLPDAEGLDLIPRLAEESPLTRIVVVTGRDSVADAVAALRAGARHYLVKPWEREELALVVDREARAVDFRESLQRRSGETVFWGTSAAMVRAREQIGRLAEAPRTTVLVQGETGAGKEVFAREIHRRTRQATAGGGGNFVALNCAAVPAQLLESELFGHERGAFTGAESRRRGMVELARDGTLFLDEIGEMSPVLQAKLLRFLQDGSYRRVGGEQELTSPCRVVAATHRDLDALRRDGDFREDLYYRLAVIRLAVPPLRERREDLLPLAAFLLRSVAAGLGRPPRPLSPTAETAILDHDWPGNVRELKNRLERALVLGRENEIRPYDLDLGRAAPEEANEELRVRRALAATGGNVSRAARQLGVERHWLRYRIRKYGLDEPGRV